MYIEIAKIASFQIFQTDMLDELLYGLGEDDKVAFNENFMDAEHVSTLFITSFGTPFYVFKLMMVILLIKRCFINRPSIHSKLDKLASRNGLIRFYMQTYYDINLYALINLATADWSPERAIVTYSNILSCILLACSILIPFILVMIHIKAK